MKQILLLIITTILITLVGCSRPETVVLAPVPPPIENIDSMDVYQCLEAAYNISKISFLGPKSGYSQVVIDRLKTEQCLILCRFRVVTGSPWDDEKNFDDVGNYIGPVWEYNGKKYPQTSNAYK